jgi:flavin-binding protein dodecin
MPAAGAGRAAYASARTHPSRRTTVSDATYRIIEITGSSTEGVQQAIDNGVTRANATLRNLDWVEVTNIRGHLEDGSISHYQVTMKIGFRMEE